jgi:uncharacterized protein (UPF0147 family)
MTDKSEEKSKQAIQVLNMINDDTSVPRNIRRAASEAINALNDKKLGGMAIRASNAISTLDEISQDPNCPLHARTK